MHWGEILSPQKLIIAAVVIESVLLFAFMPGDCGPAAGVQHMRHFRQGLEKSAARAELGRNGPPGSVKSLRFVSLGL